MGLNPKKYTLMNKGKPSVLELRTSSVNFIRFIKEYLVWQDKKTYSVQLKKDIKLSNDFIFGFARGLMDTDGYVESHGVACEVTSPNLINNLKNIVSIIKINPKITVRKRKNRKDLHRLRISKGYLKTYQKYIGFSNPRKSKKVLEILRI